jgi:DNA-binding IclR family transcriptional regulator
VLSSLQGARHLGISELAAILELPPSTVHGIVKSLQSHGLVAQEPHGNRYTLGPALLKLSNVYLDTLDVRARAMRWTSELSRRTGLATRLGVELFDEVIIIHHNSRPDGSEQMPETGLSIPAHASAMGKVLLAYNPQLTEDLLDGGDPDEGRPGMALRSLTGETITSAGALVAGFPAIRDRGVATEIDEAVLGEASVAAPVADKNGSVVAAVAVVLPSSAWPPEESVLNGLRETARNISRELGASGWPPSVATES